MGSDRGRGSHGEPRLGRLRGLFDERAEPSARQSLETALDALTAAGASVADARLPASFDDGLRCHRVIMGVEAAAIHERRLAEHRDDYLPAIRSLIEEGLNTSAAEYARCRLHQVRSQREVLTAFDDADVLVCPATVGPAPGTSTTGDPAFNSPWSYTGLPTLSFPITLSDDGLPLSIQLIGRPFAEADLFRAAVWCEQVLAK